MSMSDVRRAHGAISASVPGDGQAQRAPLVVPGDRAAARARRTCRVPRRVRLRLRRRARGLVAHDDLDWAPLGRSRRRTFVNLMTSRGRRSADELRAIASAQHRAGEWPWSFFCYPRTRPRPVTPSSFRLLVPATDALGLAVRCPACARCRSTSSRRRTSTCRSTRTCTSASSPTSSEDDALRRSPTSAPSSGPTSFDEKRLLLDG